METNEQTTNCEEKEPRQTTNCTESIVLIQIKL